MRPPSADGQGFLVVTEVYAGDARAPAFCLARALDGNGFVLQRASDLAASCEQIGEVASAGGLNTQDRKGQRGFDVRADAFALALTWLDGRAERP